MSESMNSIDWGWINREQNKEIKRKVYDESGWAHWNCKSIFAQLRISFAALGLIIRSMMQSCLSSISVPGKLKFRHQAHTARLRWSKSFRKRRSRWGMRSSTRPPQKLWTLKARLTLSAEVARPRETSWESWENVKRKNFFLTLRCIWWLSWYFDSVRMLIVRFDWKNFKFVEDHFTQAQLTWKLNFSHWNKIIALTCINVSL